jgi:hypothetical protein
MRLVEWRTCRPRLLRAQWSLFCFRLTYENGFRRSGLLSLPTRLRLVGVVRDHPIYALALEGNAGHFHRRRTAHHI